MLHTVKKVEYLEEYRLKLYFDDRSVKVVDLEDMLKKAKNMFLPLRDIGYFKQVRCDGTTISWPNGVDLCPDVLYKMGKGASRLSQKSHKPPRVSKTRRKVKTA